MTIKYILLFFLSIIGASDNSWEGTWYRNSLVDNAELVISVVTQDSFHFVLTAYSGAHTGVIEGNAVLKDNTAICILDSDDDREIHFKLTAHGIVVTTKNCEGYYGGAGVVFDGNFTSKIIPEEELADERLKNIIHDSLLIKKIKNTLGKSYTSFVYRLHVISHQKCLDNFNATVIEGCVAGMCDDMAAIVMFTPGKHFYIAWLEEDKIYYVSSDAKFKNKLPKTISEWKKQFEDVTLIIKY
ncbi:MAG: hypothetical protein AB1444_10560 [Spirochaetota bacterium]